MGLYKEALFAFIVLAALFSSKCGNSIITQWASLAGKIVSPATESWPWGRLKWRSKTLKRNANFSMFSKTRQRKEGMK